MGSGCDGIVRGANSDANRFTLVPKERGRVGPHPNVVMAIAIKPWKQDKDRIIYSEYSR